MSTLKIAIQKSGRLNEDSIQILKDCGISINNGIDQLKAEATNFPLSIIFKKFRYSSIFD
jgi:ATP phosphoribosyltransferase